MIGRRLLALGLVIALLPAPAPAWDAHGHRCITYLALDGLPEDLPEWLRDAQVRHQIAYQASEVDRWRGYRSDVLGHVNKPDHYLDLELLAEFGLTLETVPRLRNEYLRAMIISKHEHPERVSAYDASQDPDRTKEWPGLALHAIAESYARLQASFMQVRILERLKDPARAHQLVQARANAIYHMGMLSHFVGDLAQPLHTTKHYNGWVGDNPGGYTTARTFHAYIDGGVVREHRILYETLRPEVKYALTVDPRDPWNDVITYFRRSFEKMEPLYRMEKDGSLRSEPGRALIIERLCDASAMLEALYEGAWRSSVPNEKQAADFVFFDDYDPALLPQSPGQARSAAQPAQPAVASQPAAAAATSQPAAAPQPE